MARFYFTFDNSENTTLNCTGSGFCFDRLAITSGATHKTAVINARSALSSQMYAVMDTANKNGTLGITVPTDGLTISGSNLQNDAYPSGPGLYTNTEAVYNSDTRDRPAPPITKSNSTGVSPDDPWIVPVSYYNDCTTAVNNMMAAVGSFASGAQPAGGIYGRIASVNSATNMLRTLWHDSDTNYFGWDDYTPGRPTSIAVNVSTTQVIVTGINNYEFKMDRHAKIFVSYVGNINGTGVGSATNFVEFAAGSTQATFNHGVSGLSGGEPWSAMDVRAYYQLANQGVYPVALGSGSITVNGSDRVLLNQSGAVNMP